MRFHPITSEMRPGVQRRHPGLRLRAAMLSDVGLVREHNEDAAHVDLARGLFIVADGVGGHAAGEVASAIAIEVVRIAMAESRRELAVLSAHLSRDSQHQIGALLSDAVQAAHQAIRQVACVEEDKRGMGTTIDVALVLGDHLFLAHVGDSRTYLWRDGRVVQLTRDHTMAQQMAAEGDLSFDEAETSPLRSILVNAVGARSTVTVDVTHLPLRAGDRVLLCSDGLHEHAPCAALAEVLADSDPESAVASLVERARAGGGHDNITGVVVEVQGLLRAQA